MAKDKKTVAAGITAPIAATVAYGLENFLEYLTLKNEFLSSGAELEQDVYNFFNWAITRKEGSWASDEITGFDTQSPLVANLNDKIDYNAALAPNIIVGAASGLVGVLAAAKGHKATAIMSAGVNAATLVNLLYKGTELAQKSNEAWTKEVGGQLYTLNTSQASAMPLYIVGICAEIGLLAATGYFLIKNARKDVKSGELKLGINKSADDYKKELVNSDPSELRMDELSARRRALHQY